MLENEAVSDSYLLSAEERERFATWLERQAESSKGIIQQMEKLGAHAAPLVEKEKRELMACLIVAQMIRNVEEMTVGKP